MMPNHVQSSDFMDHLFRVANHPFVQHFLDRQMLPTVQPSSNLIDLDDYCLASIFHYLDFRDINNCRKTCRRLQHSVDEYLNTRKHFTYRCELNGVQIHNGQYKFNGAAFVYALQQMPNLRWLAFERCFTMKQALASCSQDILEHMITHLYDLKMLHLTRSLSITTNSMKTFTAKFNKLTHLTVSIFNEHTLRVIVDSLPNLKYLNLDESILYDYASILCKLGPNIQTFIAPVDLKNEKMAIIEALCQGNGKNLERLEMKICIYDLACDVEFFKKIGNGLTALKWFKCEMKSSHRETTQSFYKFNNEIISTHNINCESISHSEPIASTSQYEHRHHRLVRGLHALKELQVLILTEEDYFDSEDRCTLLDEDSMLKIFQSCSQIKMLSIACSLRRNSHNYYPNRFESQENVKATNQVLNQMFNSKQEELSNIDLDTICTISPTEQTNDNNKKVIPPNRSVSYFGDLFELDTDYEDSYSMDSGISDFKYRHIIGDGSLGSLDVLLPKLLILQLRGVRLGMLSMDAIANLSQLKCLHLDSFTIDTDELIFNHCFSKFMNKIAQASLHNQTNVRITNIPSI